MINQHPLSAIFPAMPEAEFKALVADIQENGQFSAITLYEGMILDGWHRYQACRQTGIEPLTVDYKGADPVALVRSANAHRRHLTASQRALIEAELASWRTAGRPNNHALSARLTETTAESAAAAHVSERTIAHAKEVISKGSDELKEEVREGKVSVKAAAESLKPAKPPAAPKADPRDERIAALESQLETATENLPELANLAASAEVFKAGDEFNAMVALRAELDSTRRRRDELMNENAEMRKTIAYWKKRAEKAEK